jgi:hypothetical protein
VKHLHINRWNDLGGRATRAKYSGRSVNQLSLPGGDLVRMHIILPRQFGQRYLCLERRSMGSALSFAMVVPDPRHTRRFQADFSLIDLSEFGRPRPARRSTMQWPSIILKPR